jgi:hypothetical protein
MTFAVFRGLLILMDPEKLQAWWFYRQGLDGRLAGKSASEVLQQTGWARSVGGVNPYLSLFARGGISRQTADDAAARLEIHELPAARGCTYVVPAADYGLALKSGASFASEGRTARKLGVTDAEIEKLCTTVLDVLGQGPLDPEELRRAAGGKVRSLGEEGRKKGLANTLPAALERLQSKGEIRRVAANGRFDQQRYRYALWRPNPLAKFGLSEEETFRELARRFFFWIGPASLREFQWLSGLSAKAARTVTGPLDLNPVEPDSALLMPPEGLAEFLDFTPPKTERIVLVSSLDGISHLRRNVESLLAAGDLKRSAFCERGLMDLSSHAILCGGRLVGLWEYDVDTASIVWASFAPVHRALAEIVTSTERLVREELGDARAFSLDSPKSRAPRIAALRKMGKLGGRSQ